MAAILLVDGIRNKDLEDLRRVFRKIKGMAAGSYTVYVTNEPVRSLSLNAYYWGVVVDMIEKETGHTAAEIHKAMKYRFNMTGRQTTAGNVLSFGGTTKAQNQTRFFKYVENVKLWALYFLNLHIPEPEQLTDEHILTASLHG